MPWDARKAAGDRVLSGDWNDMVDYVKAISEPDLTKIDAALGKIGSDYYPTSPYSYEVFKVRPTYYLRKGLDQWLDN